MENSIKIKYEELSNIYEELAVTEGELRDKYEELRRNEEALRISEERYRLAVEGANDALWDWDFLNNKFFISEKYKDPSWATNCPKAYSFWIISVCS